MTQTSFIFSTNYIIRETLCECVWFACSCFNHCSTIKEKKKIWPVHCGQKREGSGRGTVRQLEKSREGFEPCKKKNHYAGTGIIKNIEGCSVRWREIGLIEAEMIRSIWRTGRQSSTTESRGNMRTRGPAGDLNNQQFSHWSSGTLHNSSVIQRTTVCVCLWVTCCLSVAWDYNSRGREEYGINSECIQESLPVRNGFLHKTHLLSHFIFIWNVLLYIRYFHMLI